MEVKEGKECTSGPRKRTEQKEAKNTTIRDTQEKVITHNHRSRRPATPEKLATLVTGAGKTAKDGAKAEIEVERAENMLNNKKSSSP